MKLKLYVPLAFLIFTSCSPKTNAEQSTIESKDGWILVWSDEFNYEGLPDSTKWSYDTEGNKWKWGNNEAQHYTDSKKENAWVQNGMLTITALKEKIADSDYSSARLITKGKGDWLYGRFEIRAKLPSARGTWPAIWMLPTDWEYGGWPSSGEIDIMENVGYDADTIVASAHTESYNHSLNTQKNAKIWNNTSYIDFQTYALEWEANEYRVYIDDVLFFTYKNNGTGYKAWPYDKRFHLLLNLAIGGNWGGLEGIDDNKFPHTFYIDYVRIYQKQ